MWEFLDKVVFINLEKRKDRLEHMNEVCKVFPPEKVVRFNAIEYPPKGIIGCAKSHAGVLEMAIENKWKNVLVLEDDATWNKFEQGYARLEELVKNDYDVIMLGGNIRDNNGQYDPITHKVYDVQSAHAYLVNEKFYEVLLNNLREGIRGYEATGFDWIYPNDQYWKRVQRQYNWYMIVPNLMYQTPSHSDTGNCYMDVTNVFIL